MSSITKKSNFGVAQVKGFQVFGDDFLGHGVFQGFFAQFQALVEDLEEFFFIAVGKNPDLRQVQGDDTHVEAAVEFIVAFGVFPGA